MGTEIDSFLTAFARYPQAQGSADQDEFGHVLRLDSQIAADFASKRHPPEGESLDPASIGNSQDILPHFVCGVIHRVGRQPALAMAAQVEGNDGEAVLETADIAG